jgi:hypothetical protein
MTIFGGFHNVVSFVSFLAYSALLPTCSDVWQLFSGWVSIQMHFYSRNRGVCIIHDKANTNAEEILSQIDAQEHEWVYKVELASYM